MLNIALVLPHLDMKVAALMQYLLKSEQPVPWFKGEGLNLACLNVNRPAGKTGQVKLCIYEQHPDIFGLCETFLDNKINNNLLQRSGFSLERRDRQLKSGGS